MIGCWIEPPRVTGRRGVERRKRRTTMKSSVSSVPPCDAVTASVSRIRDEGWNRGLKVGDPFVQGRDHPPGRGARPITSTPAARLASTELVTSSWQGPHDDGRTAGTTGNRDRRSASVPPRRSTGPSCGPRPSGDDQPRRPREGLRRRREGGLRAVVTATPRIHPQGLDAGPPSVTRCTIPDTIAPSSTPCTGPPTPRRST